MMSSSIAITVKMMIYDDDDDSGVHGEGEESAGRKGRGRRRGLDSG